MTNDPGDRHVLAACVAAGVEGIVTFNRKHVPTSRVWSTDRGLAQPGHRGAV